MNDNGTRMVCLWLCCWKYIAKIRPNSQGNCLRFWSWYVVINPGIQTQVMPLKTQMSIINQYGKILTGKPTKSKEQTSVNKNLFSAHSAPTTNNYIYIVCDMFCKSYRTIWNLHGTHILWLTIFPPTSVIIHYSTNSAHPAYPWQLLTFIAKVALA